MHFEGLFTLIMFSFPVTKGYFSEISANIIRTFSSLVIEYWDFTMFSLIRK